MSETLQTKLALALGVAESTPEDRLVSTVHDLVAYRERWEEAQKREQRIAELQNICHCDRQTALNIITAQQKTGA
jgi:hypothetical protein